MALTDLPMSARLPQTERRYQDDKAAGRIISLIDERPIFKGNHTYFKIIENRYPYDAIFKLHHMLVCKRPGATHDNFTVEEKRELEAIRFAEFFKYGSVIENFKAKSISDIWHIHLVSYYDTRPSWLMLAAARPEA
jgi:hypothetical protein